VDKSTQRLIRSPGPDAMSPARTLQNRLPNAVAIPPCQWSRNTTDFSTASCEQGVLQAIPRGPDREHHAPRLDIGVRRRVLGQGESFNESRPRHFEGQELPYRMPNPRRPGLLRFDDKDVGIRGSLRAVGAGSRGGDTPSERAGPRTDDLDACDRCGQNRAQC